MPVSSKKKRLSKGKESPDKAAASEPVETASAQDEGDDPMEGVTPPDEEGDANPQEEDGGIRIGDIYITPPPPPACTFDTDGPRLVITHIENYFFKSYAGKQVLGPFHKNFTSIVGPNGSGKSNVIDSMLFVFGYRAQKIRSKKISVLIHNSNKHPNVESCSVHVHFQEVIDKSASEFEVVPNSQFVVSRSAFKDNSSFYTINGKKVPFKEVGKLLRLHGVDLDHNRFLILQGEVEQIAMMKPKAQTEHDTGMLEFLEDIIGCSRFKDAIGIFSKRVEELNEQRTEKLNRVKVVEKEKDELEGAKNEALEFLKLENEIIIKDSIINQALKYHTQETKEKAVAEKEQMVNETKDFLEKLETLKALRADHEKHFQEKQEVQEKCIKLADDKKAEYSALERKDLQCRENLKHAKVKGKKLTKSLETEQQKLKELTEQPEKSEKLIAELEKKKGTVEKKLEEEQAKLEKVMASLKKETEGLQVEKDKFESQLLELQKAVNETKQKLNIQQSELDLYLSTETNEKKKLEELQNNIKKSSDTLAQKNQLLSDLQKRMPELEQQYREVQSQLPQVVEEESKLSNDFRVKRFRMEEMRSTMQASKSKSRVLQVLLEQRDRGNLPGILGRLGDLGGIDEKFDVAISTACGPLDNIVTDTMDTAQRCVQFLKDHNVGVATFIALDKMTRWIPYTKQRIDTPESVPRLFDLVRVRDERVLPAFYFALRDTLVANNLEQATRIGLQGRTRHRVVTLGGELIDISGTMSGGGSRVSRGRMGKAVVENTSSQQELEVMVQQIEEMNQRLEELRQHKVVLEDKQAQLQRELRAMNDTQKKATSEVKLLSDQHSTLQRQVEEQAEKVKSIHTDKNKVKQLQTSIAGAQKDYDAAAGKAGKVEAEVQRLHNRIMEITGGKMEAAQKAVDSLSNQIDTLTSAMTKSDVAAKTAKRNMKKSTEKIASLEAEVEENKAGMEKMKGEFTILEDQARKVMEELAEANKQKDEMEEAMEGIVKGLSKVKEEEQECQSKNIEVKNKLKDCNENIAKLERRIRDLEFKASKLKLHEIENETVKELPVLSPEELQAVNVETVNLDKNSLEEDIRKIKPNMAAIDEYKKKESQYLQRVAELETVTEQRDTQRGHYDYMRKQRLTDFMEGFTIITTKLKEVYQMLTLGGDAELELVDSLDPFSEGIIFSVRPPKKSWKNISNLSGGEKTLSSLALVFALHFYRPTSLYVMDEIDAALDFRNVSIVGHYIKERTKNAQFIVISLRNNMFELADRLVGIFKTYDCTKSVTINPQTIGKKNQEQEQENREITVAS